MARTHTSPFERSEENHAVVRDVIGCLEEVVDLRIPGTLVFGTRAFCEILDYDLYLYGNYGQPRVDDGDQQVTDAIDALLDPAFETLLKVAQGESNNERGDDIIGTNEILKMARALGRLVTTFSRRFDEVVRPTSACGISLHKPVALKSNYSFIKGSDAIQGGFMQQSPYLDSNASDLMAKYMSNSQYRNIMLIRFLTESLTANQGNYVFHFEASYLRERQSGFGDVLVGDLLVGYEIAIEDVDAQTITYMGSDGKFRVIQSPSDPNIGIDFSALHKTENDEGVKTIIDKNDYYKLVDLLNRVHYNFGNPN